MLRLSGRSLRLDRPLVMGILNITPDSFSDGGHWLRLDDALRHAGEMVDAGVDVIDVGGESTRPGSRAVSTEEELNRVIPLIELLSGETGVPISIDSSKPDVMQAAVSAGAAMINDVFALRHEGAVELASSLGVPVCLMHMRGQPRDMQQRTQYEDVVAEVAGFLEARVNTCLAAGIARDDIVLDPGFGFGKNLSQNVALFHAIPRLRQLGFPLLVGVSRKSMLGEITGRQVNHRLAASVAAAVLAAQQGAAILRVHDVRETVDALKTCLTLDPGQAKH